MFRTHMNARSTTAAVWLIITTDNDDAPKPTRRLYGPPTFVNPLRLIMVATVAVLPSVFACHCGPDGAAGYDPNFDQPTRPIVVPPDIDPPAIENAPVGQARIRPVSMLPPIVRGPRQVDVYVQDDAIVDVLWVVDNSGSLINERQLLAAQFDRFLGVLLAADVDFHVGVTSTDLGLTGDRGQLRGRPRYIDRSTPDPLGVFRRAVTFPDDDTVSLEEGLGAMAAALGPDLTSGTNAGFVRDEAALAVIVVSDEDDGSLGPTAHFTRFLRSLKGPGRDANISLSAVVGPEPDGCVPPGEELIFGAEARAGERYIEVAQDTGGLIESICAADFAPFVEALATSLAGLRRFFPLSAPPAPTSIEVTVDGARVPESATNGWTLRIDERALVFNGMAVPPPGAEVLIAYDVFF